MKLWTPSIFTACLVLTAVGFQNCSKANFTSDLSSQSDGLGNDDNPAGGGGGGELPVTEVEAEQNCKNRALTAKSIPVNFPKPNRCDWGNNGNGDMRNGYAQARSEQNFNLPIPANAVICDMSFSFPNQYMQYDDEIIMTFNGFVLASSYKNLSDMFPKDGDLRRYEWSAIKEQSTDVAGYDPYIVGEELGLASVTMPRTQETGQIQMSMDKQVFYKFAAKKVAGRSHAFGFVTTGDNDDETDCQHEPVNFNVSVKYYVP